ncbi:carboxypeptidase M32 [Carnimonas bestiolae]|uniref:carboxypeptidase M32 n=1 Tax=Carnimonas bestiolae TaxID=3402172 RepID=UPI003EDBA5F4
MSTAYSQLTDTFDRISRLNHLLSIGAWDMNVMMSAKGSEARGAAMAELGLEVQRRLSAPQISEWLNSAEQESLSEIEQANVREMRREYEYATALPPELNEALSIAGSRCEVAWRQQRRDNDWEGFKDNLREVVRLSREKAERLSELKGVSRYDAMLDEFEPGMTSETLDVVFDDVRSWLPDLIQRALEKQQRAPLPYLQQSFPQHQQHALALDVMKLLQFDFDAGRLDVSVHPFSGGVPTDSRITTRYDENDFVTSLMSVIHETGHTRYEQNLPKQFAGQPVGLARSMGIHESQSLSFEMQLARTDAFLAIIAPLVNTHLGTDFSAGALAQRVRHVAPGKIRVDADELTYPAHVMLRYEIERALIEGDLEVDDIPGAWDERMQRYLNIDTRGDFANGCMQDIHWTDGAFGYFPTYSLGAIYAAQLFKAASHSTPTMMQQIESGKLTELFDWYRANIWQHGRRYSSQQLITRATGKSLDIHAYRAHLESRYG